MYDPGTNEFTTVQDMNVPRVGHYSSILSNGAALVFILLQQHQFLVLLEKNEKF